MQHTRKRAGLLKSALLGAATLGALSLAGAGVARAAPITWSFNTVTGDLGTNTHTYASNPVLPTPPGPESVTATGYKRSSGIDVTVGGSTVTQTANTDLYGKNSPPSEQGVGLANDPTGQHEISTSGFIQLDLSQLSSPPLSTMDMTFGTNSVQTASNDVWYVFGSNTAGSFSTSDALKHGTVATDMNLSNILGTWQYLDVTTSSGNVLIKQLDNGYTPKQSVPEPGSLALLGTGLLGLGLVARRRRRKA